MPKDAIWEDLERRARKALISYAIFRWESALIIGLTILLAVVYPSPFPWWRWYYWLGLGLIGEALIIYTSLTDERTAQHVVAAMFREQYSPGALRLSKYRQQMEKALEYQARIHKAIAEVKEGILRDRLARAGHGVNEWIAQIFQLAKRLEHFESNEVIAEDMKSVPAALKNLEARYKLEDDERVRADLLKAIEQKQAQWRNLQQLQNTMESAEVRLGTTLTALGTVYSQILLIAAKGDEGAAAERLATDIAEQTTSLQDLIETMDEVLKY